MFTNLFSCDALLDLFPQGPHFAFVHDIHISIVLSLCFTKSYNIQSAEKSLIQLFTSAGGLKLHDPFQPKLSHDSLITGV